MENAIVEVYNLLNYDPYLVYEQVFNIRGISIKKKLTIIASCLSDQRYITLAGTDPKNRQYTIKQAAKDLEKLAAKIRIANEFH